MKNGGDDEVDRGWFADDLTARPLAELPAVPTSSSPRAGLPPGEWEAALETLRTLEREISASVDPRRRAALSFEIGRIHEELLGDERRALTFYQRAFQCDPTHVPSMEAGQRVFARGGKWGMVLRLMESEVRVHPSPTHRARRLIEMAELYQTRFGRLVDAEQTYRAALDLDAQNVTAWRGLAQLLERRGNHRDAAEALVTGARASDDTSLSRAMLLTAADLFSRGQASDRADEVLTEVASRWPDKPEAPERLAASHAAAGRWVAYIDVLLDRAEQTAGPRARASLLAHLARVAALRLGDAELTGHLLVRALASDPEHAEALELLAAHHESAGRWEAATDAIERLVAATPVGADQTAVRWRLAEMQLERRGDVSGAVTTLRELLATDPGWRPAVELLGRLLTQREDWDGVLELLHAELAGLGDPRQQAGQFLRIGEIHELRRGDWPAAARAYREAINRDPDLRHAGKALARMLVRMGEWAEYVALLSEEVGRIPDAVEQIAFHERIADAWANHLDQPEQAILAWRRVLEIKPRHAPAIRQIARLCAQTRRFEALLEMNDLELELLREPAKCLSLLVRSAEIAEFELAQPDRAQKYLERALALDPRYVPAIVALGRLCQRRGHWRELVALYRREIELATDRRQAVALLFVVAEILRDQLDDLDGAAAAFGEALERTPDDLACLRALRRIHAARGDAVREAELLTIEVEHVVEPRSRARLLLELGRLQQVALGATDQAVETFQRAVLTDPEQREARDALFACLIESEEHEALVAIRRRLAAAGGAPDEVIAHWMAVAQTGEVALGSPELAIEAFEAVLEIEPGNLRALLNLERLQLERGESAELVATYGRLAAASRTPRTRAGFLVQQARLAERALGDVSLARRLFQDALEVDPHARAALEWLEVDACAVGDVERLAAVLEPRLAVADGPRERATVLTRVAEVLRRAGELSRAAECFEALMVIEPDSAVAHRALRSIYHALGRTEDAVRVTERLGRLSHDPQEAAALLLEAGSSRERDRTTASAAVDAYLDALRRDPRDEVAAAAVARVCGQTGRWSAWVDALETRAGALPERAAELLAEAGELSARRLDDTAGAIRLLGYAMERDSASLDTLKKIADLLASLEAWPLAARAYSLLWEVASEPELRVAIAFRLAALHDEKLGERGEAIRWLENIRARAPEHLDALDRLARLRADIGDVSGARAMLSLAVAQAEGERAAELQVRLARLSAADGDLGAACEAGESAFKMLPGDRRLLIDLAMWYAESQRPARVRALFRNAARDAPPIDDAEASMMHARAADLLQLAGAEHEEVIEALERAVAAAPGDAVLRLRLADHLAKVGPDAARAEAEYRRVVADDPFSFPAIRALLRYSERSDETDRAYELARLLIACDEAGPAAHAVVSRAHDRVRRWPARGLTEVERAALQSVSEPPEFVEILREIAARLPTLFAPPPGTPSAPPPAAFVALAERVAAGLDVELPPLVLDPRALHEVSSVDGALCYSAGLLSLSSGEQSFVLAVGLELHRRGVAFLSRWAPQALAGLVAALARHGEEGSDEEGLSTSPADLRALGSSRLPSEAQDPVVGGELAALARRIEAWDLARSRAAVLESARRTALLVSGGVLASVSALRRTAPEEPPLPPRSAPGLAAVIRWVVADPYYTMRRALSLSADPGHSGG